ncbi:hypothetical protein [Arsenophonus sp.]|uniref:hypothetical protein n=1 Tax=Arsenophonus sp. TaxID=1872640 RepID=UPI002864CE32|nr:hypothetical protein [Arsenophonus sp.]MDR5611461.1 hypothetical protein [Arsenophonus sp.]MDR5615527.1 hypothetical protein [Arsenophonus sp.]
MYECKRAYSHYWYFIHPHSAISKIWTQKKTAELTGAVAVRKVFLAPKRTIAHDFFFRQWLLLGYTYLNTGG